MVDNTHLKILLQGVDVWNKWRQDSKETPNLQGVHLIQKDLTGIDFRETNLKDVQMWEATLKGANLWGSDLENANLFDSNFENACLWETNFTHANLSGANLAGTDLKGATLWQADLFQVNFSNADFGEGFNLSGENLKEANLSGANLMGAFLNQCYLSKSNLSNANLERANLSFAYLVDARLHNANLRAANLQGVDLRRADLNGSDLTGADLRLANLVEADLTSATLTECMIYGISAWNIRTHQARQADLIISDDGEPTITVDNVEVAQFIYLLINNEKLRDVIDTIGKKAVLILGRFTPERKVILDGLREALRKHNYIPILFDFPKPKGRTLTETVQILAHLARFIIVDLTDPSSSPHELASIRDITSVAIQPIINKGKTPYSMFDDLKRGRDTILPLFEYDTKEQLLRDLPEKIIAPAENIAKKTQSDE